MAAHTTLPVIGIPIKSSTLDGLDALLANRADAKGRSGRLRCDRRRENAALLAAQMLAIQDEGLAEKLSAMKKEMEEEIVRKDAKLQEEVNGL